jgi:hypothetical protein
MPATTCRQCFRAELSCAVPCLNRTKALEPQNEPHCSGQWACNGPELVVREPGVTGCSCSGEPGNGPIRTLKGKPSDGSWSPAGKGHYARTSEVTV